MSEHALKRKAFLEGFFGFYFGKKHPVYIPDDTEAMRADWEATGDYLREAMREYGEREIKQLTR